MMKFFNSMSCYTMVHDFLRYEKFFLHVQKYFDTMGNIFHTTKKFCYLNYEKFCTVYYEIIFLLYDEKHFSTRRRNILFILHKTFCIMKNIFLPDDQYFCYMMMNISYATGMKKFSTRSKIFYTR